MTLNSTLGFLGFGNMGSAIAKGLLETGTLTAEDIVVYDVDESKCDSAQAMGILVAGSPADLASGVHNLVLAVKPQTMGEALEQIKPTLSSSTLVISIAAGISIGYLQDKLGAETRVARVMPNTPALVGDGAAGIALSGNCSETDGQTARMIFEAVGIATLVPEEAMDAVTALSGSGPAYFFYMTECLVKAAMVEGLDEATATRLAAQTLLGAGRLLTESGEPASVLRERVTSKGGTTAAALTSFQESDLEGIVRRAVRSAAKRSRELGN